MKYHVDTSTKDKHTVKQKKVGYKVIHTYAWCVCEFELKSAARLAGRNHLHFTPTATYELVPPFY